MPMTAGFPRPRKFIEKIRTTYTWDNMPGKEWDKKSYPIPYSAKLHRVGTLAKTRVRECRQKDLCIVCGVPVQDDNPWVYIYHDTLHVDSGPFHEKCVKLTEKMCPVVHLNPHTFTFKQVTWAELNSRTLNVDNPCTQVL